MSTRKQVEYIITLPKGLVLDDLSQLDFKVDDKWPVTVRVNHVNVRTLPLGVARRLYGNIVI